DDPAKAFDYYSKHYGWQKDFAHDMGAMGMYQTFRTDQPLYTGGMMNRKGPGIPEGIPPHWQYYFTVDDIEAAQKRLIDAEGQELIVEFTVCGRKFVGLNGGPKFVPNEAVSFMIFTDDQAETDRLWNAIISNGGQESMCGWCKDRWGFSWQITPRALLAATT